MVDVTAEGARAGRDLWPAAASWIPDEVLTAWNDLARRHPSIASDSARAAFLDAARAARKSSPTKLEAQGRPELLARLAAVNAARTAATRERNDADGQPRDTSATAIVRRRRESLERRRGRHEEA